MQPLEKIVLVSGIHAEETEVAEQAALKLRDELKYGRQKEQVLKVRLETVPFEYSFQGFCQRQGHLSNSWKELVRRYQKDPKSHWVWLEKIKRQAPDATIIEMHTTPHTVMAAGMGVGEPTDMRPVFAFNPGGGKDWQKKFGQTRKWTMGLQKVEGGPERGHIELIRRGPQWYYFEFPAVYKTASAALQKISEKMPFLGPKRIRFSEEADLAATRRAGFFDSWAIRKCAHLVANGLIHERKINPNPRRIYERSGFRKSPLNATKGKRRPSITLRVRK